MLILLNNSSTYLRADRACTPTRQATHLLSALIFMSLITEVIMKLTQARLRELLHYDPETGVFAWINPTNKSIKKGDIAGSINGQGYREIKIDYKQYNASRLAWLYMHGYFPEHEVDHRNRIRGDGRWENLRHTSHSCNMRNKSIYKNNKSGIAGVIWHKRQWNNWIR